ncbi:rRNA pseudouridine synthase, partial [Mycoplasmopsis pullorum]
MNERLQKLLSQAGIASRREAENIIKAGRVKVNGKVAQLGDKASFKDRILVDNKP